MDAQSDVGEVPLAYLPPQLVEAHPALQHQVVAHPLVVGHVVDHPVEGGLHASLGRRQLRGGCSWQGFGRHLLWSGGITVGLFACTAAWRPSCFFTAKKK